MPFLLAVALTFFSSSKPGTPELPGPFQAFKFIERVSAGSNEDNGGDKSVHDRAEVRRGLLGVLGYGNVPQSPSFLQQMVRQKQSSTPSSTTSDLSEDPDTEEALKGFDFLASPEELDGSAEWRSGENSEEWGETRTFEESGICAA